jgi:hypothetical protein
MSVSKEQLEKLTEALAKEGLLENFVYGLIDSWYPWEDFANCFVELANDELYPN